MSETIETVRTIRFDPLAAVDPLTQTTTAEWYNSGAGAFKAGFWASKPGRADVHYQKDELCIILEGKVRLTDQAGHVETYAKGDTFLVPAGFKGIWETVEPTRKFYALHKSAET